MKYTAKEIRACLDFVISDREPRILTWKSGGCHPASITECALWDALAERIKADESATPVAEVYEYPRELQRWNSPMLRAVRFLGAAPLPIGTKLFAYPPAQATQVEARTIRPCRVNNRDFPTGSLVQQVIGRADACYDRFHDRRKSNTQQLDCDELDADTVTRIIASVSHINTDGMDGDSWDRILVRAALEHFSKEDRYE